SQSVNTFFYYIGGGFEDFNGLGVDRIVNYAKLFGLGSQTGVDLANEASGFLPTKEWKEKTKGERWYIGDTYHLAIGQGDILVTPLQVANYTAVFANQGKLYRPHLIKQVLTDEDKLIGDIESAPIRENFIDSYNINVVRQGMRQAVTTGSARGLDSLSVKVAGKTGTAQWSSKKDNHSWFTGFAPYDNPEIVITILVEEGGEGSETAVPIAREVIEWYFGRDTNNNE
ncbi:MAG: penicillin-binding transpeptidase domain-containing protein, partial [Patescibacteria group bacterium]